MTAKWLLLKILSALHDHIEVVHPNAKKRGILLLRTGSNTQQALHDALAVQRCTLMAQDKLDTDVPAENNKDVPENGISAMAEHLHNMIRAQAAEFTGKELEEDTPINKLNFDDVIRSTDPNLWAWIWVALYGAVKDIPTEMPDNKHEQAKPYIRALQSPPFPLLQWKPGQHLHM